MPNYEFQCSACEHEFEKNVPMAERDSAMVCPECGKSTVARKVSAVKLSYSGFKDPISRAGSGWNDVLKRVKKGSARKNTIRTR